MRVRICVLAVVGWALTMLEANRTGDERYHAMFGSGSAEHRVQRSIAVRPTEAIYLMLRIRASEPDRFEGESRKEKIQMWS